MEEVGAVGLIIIIINLLASYNGFRHHSFFDKYSFHVDEILINKDYKRLITSGFLHVSWLHLLFNMVSLLCFSYGVEQTLGHWQFAVIYFGSLVGGNLFALFIHRHHYDYSAVGASGAISGIIFASIALFPGIEIGIPGIPLYLPAWAYGLLYVLFSIYGIRSQRDNIGHEAHLGGGVVGLLIAVAMMPESIRYNYIPILLILVPSFVFIYLIVTRPEFLLVDNLFKKKEIAYTIEDKYNSRKVSNQNELDGLLDKISRRGIQSLTKKERERLNELSNGK